MSAQEGVTQHIQKSFVSYLPPFVVLVAFSVLSVFAYWYFTTQKTAIVRQRFEKESVVLLASASERFNRDIAIIRGIQGLFIASENVNRQEFYEYIGTLDLQTNYPGISSIGYATRVGENFKEQFTTSLQQDTTVRTEGYPNVVIYPESKSTEQYVLTYIYPEDALVSGIGFDMTSEPQRNEAIYRAIQTKNPAASGKIQLVTDQTDAVLLFLPVEKDQQVRGVIVLNLQLKNFYSSITDLIGNKDVLTYTVSEKDEKTGVDTVLYTSGSVAEKISAPIVKTEQIVFGQKTWDVTFTADGEYGLTTIEKFFPLGIAEALVAIGILLFILLYQATRVKDQAVHLAETMVVDLKESENRFRAITDSAKDAIVMMDSQARVVLWNKAAERMFGWTQEEMRGKLFHVMITTTPEHQHTEHLLIFGQTGESSVLGKALELPVKRKDGTIFTIELTVARTKLHDEWHAVGIMRDITERLKQSKALAEQASELERMNKLMVDRELKMIELKKQTTKTS